MSSQQKIVRKNYTIRLPDHIRTELARLSADRSLKIGKNVPLADILLEALEYGLPLVDRENKHHIAMPHLTKTEAAAKMASELVMRGYWSMFPDGETPSVPSPSH